MIASFNQIEPQRAIVFGPGAIERAAGLLGEGYTLLSTERALAGAPSVAERAGSVVEVPAGYVEVVAARLRPGVAGERLVALGGGRVIDVAKALAAAEPPRTVAAVPTTLSGAERPGVHRHAEGVPWEAARARPTLVINDPGLSASAPPEGLAASAANALGHATVALFSDHATPFSMAIAREAIERFARAWSHAEADRDELALAALQAGWAVDHSGLGPHHALSQTAVRVFGAGHAQANAALLPGTVAAIRRRKPAELEELDARIGGELETLARRLRQLAGWPAVAAREPHEAGQAVPQGEDGVEHRLAAGIDAVAQRPELAFIPPVPDRAELLGIYREAGIAGAP